MQRNLNSMARMFQIPRPNLIQSDAGFSVEVLGRTSLLHTEDVRKMKIDSEVLQGPSGLIAYVDSIIRWLPPHEADEVDDACRNRIVQNLEDAFRFRTSSADASGTCPIAEPALPRNFP